MNKKKWLLLAGGVLSASVLGGCTGGKNAEHTQAEDIKTIGTYEAEEAVLSGNVSFGNSLEGYSGNGYVQGFESEEDACTFKIVIEENGFYDLQFSSAGIGGYKENFVLVDEEPVGNLVNEQTSFTDGG